MRLSLIDNYDSFTYNLYQQFRRLGAQVEVYRNDEITLTELESKNFDSLVISPGPGKPQDAGISPAAVRSYLTKLPILGICLGHQIIAEAFGGTTIHSPEPTHGLSSEVHHHGKELFFGIPSPAKFMRYHSLATSPSELPEELVVTAQTDSGIIMGIAHKELPIFGVQFHPESFDSEYGDQVIQNFLNRCSQ